MSLKIKLSERTMSSLSEEATRLEMKPSTLARMHLCQLYNFNESGNERVYVIKIENWREIEEYAKARRTSLDSIINNALPGYLRKNRLSTSQKARLEDLPKN